VTENRALNFGGHDRDRVRALAAIDSASSCNSKNVFLVIKENMARDRVSRRSQGAARRRDGNARRRGSESEMARKSLKAKRCEGGHGLCRHVLEKRRSGLLVLRGNGV
jgi:hypothetical protein